VAANDLNGASNFLSNAVNTFLQVRNSNLDRQERNRQTKTQGLLEAKARGLLPVLDDQGNIVDYQEDPVKKAENESIKRFGLLKQTAEAAKDFRNAGYKTEIDPATGQIKSAVPSNEPDYEKMNKVLDYQIKTNNLSKNKLESDPLYKAREKAASATVEQIAKKRESMLSGADAFDRTISLFNDPNKSTKEKLDVGRGMILKTLNDPINSDALGVQEAERNGANLELMNFTRGGNPFGRNMPAFVKQLENARDILRQRAEDSRKRMLSPDILAPDSITSGGSGKDPARIAKEKAAAALLGEKYE
jgi:hypothetical protein